MTEATPPGISPRGRRPLPPAQVQRQRNVYLTDAEYARLQEAGDGNASAGVRRLLGEVAPAP